MNQRILNPEAVIMVDPPVDRHCTATMYRVSTAYQAPSSGSTSICQRSMPGRRHDSSSWQALEMAACSGVRWTCLNSRCRRKRPARRDIGAFTLRPACPCVTHGAIGTDIALRAGAQLQLDPTQFCARGGGVGLGGREFRAESVAYEERHADGHADDVFADRAYVLATAIQADRGIRASVPFLSLIHI